MADPFVGEIRLFGFNFEPRGWAFCAGQILPISQNTALFSLIGTFYGGDGRTTFALPDLRGRAALSYGRGPGLSDYQIGQKEGTETVTLNTTEMPAHTHSLTGVTGTASLHGVSQGGGESSPAGNYMAALDDAYAASGTEVAMNANSVKVSLAGGQVGTTGGSLPHNNMQPSLACNYCIALVGIFPSRS
ncbi:phage tail protein [Hoeflea ulvae]|uniref:Tail fiber protein n=1 Tax=Hoeflea ulvae TaxID=2983764 RepID=A0ABT3YCN1_9HYPH|nr:tail fiber protein [Hoeflea ulvae]MCY0093640.1 tail fiber protein [Hoeflea ulvae]